MRKKLYYIVKSELHYYPPCVSQIRILHDLGVEVTVVYGSSDAKILEILNAEGIRLVELGERRGVWQGKPGKVYHWLSYRKALRKFLKSVAPTDSVLWFGTAESLIPMYGALRGRTYVASFLELLDKCQWKLRALKPLAQKAAVVTTCEETRSYLMQYRFQLSRLPYTIPNKPYRVPYARGGTPTTKEGQYILEQTKGHPYVIYQGILQNPEYMIEIAKVMRDHYPDRYLVLMGIDKYHIADGVKTIFKNTVVSEYIPAPEHLQVTANAYIGVIYYKPDELNKVFCAPNKIFEYTCFGLPVIGNNIPGLKNTIGRAGAGVCIDFSYESILAAFQRIDKDYDVIQQNALHFYHSVDTVNTVREIALETNIL